jgi:uncharacterized protein YaaN involved in tellurite resistance
MSEEIRARAAQTLQEVEAVTQVLLPEPKGELVPVDQAQPADRAEIERRLMELDMRNTQSIIQFGASAQTELQAISQEMLTGVRNKDVGPCRRVPARDGGLDPRLFRR